MQKVKGVNPCLGSVLEAEMLSGLVSNREVAKNGLEQSGTSKQ